MANFSKILGLATTALVFAGVAFGQTTCFRRSASQTPLIRVEGTTELVGEYLSPSRPLRRLTFSTSCRFRSPVRLCRRPARPTPKLSPL